MDHDELSQLGSGFTSAVKNVHGTSFASGPFCTTLYQVSGGSNDYMYDVACVCHSLCSKKKKNDACSFILSKIKYSFGVILVTMVSSCLPTKFAHLVRKLGQESNIYWRTSTDANMSLFFAQRLHDDKWVWRQWNSACSSITTNELFAKSICSTALFEPIMTRWSLEGF